MSNGISKCPEIRKLVKQALESGDWELAFGKKHNKLIHKPTKMLLAIAVSPSCHRASKNLKSEIRQLEAGTHKMLEGIRKNK